MESPFGGNNEGATAGLDVRHGLQPGHSQPELLVHRDNPAGAPLGGVVREVDSVRKVSFGVRDHRPFQGGDFLGPQTRLQGQEKDDPVPFRMAGCGEVSVNGFRLALGEDLGLFPEAHRRLH